MYHHEMLFLLVFVAALLSFRIGKDDRNGKN